MTPQPEDKEGREEVEQNICILLEWFQIAIEARRGGPCL